MCGKPRRPLGPDLVLPCCPWARYGTWYHCTHHQHHYFSSLGWQYCFKAYALASDRGDHELAMLRLSLGSWGGVGGFVTCFSVLPGVAGTAALHVHKKRVLLAIRKSREYCPQEKPQAEEAIDLYPNVTFTVLHTQCQATLFRPATMSRNPRRSGWVGKRSSSMKN